MQSLTDDSTCLIRAKPMQYCHALNPEVRLIFREQKDRSYVNRHPDPLIACSITQLILCPLRAKLPFYLILSLVALQAWSTLK